MMSEASRSLPHQVPLPAVAPAIKDPSLFAQLLNSLDAIQAHTLSRFVTQHLHDFPHSKREIQTELKGGVDAIVRVIDTRIFPFSFPTVAAAVWRESFGMDGVNPLRWEEIGTSTFQTQLNTHADLGAYVGVVQGKIVMRRIDTADRATILRVGRFVCGEFVPGSQPIQHYQWTVITKPLIHTIHMESACQVMTCDVSLHTIVAAEDLERTARDDRFSEFFEAFADVSKHRLDRVQASVGKILLPGRSS